MKAKKATAKRGRGRPKGDVTERLNYRLPLGTVAGIEAAASAASSTVPEYLSRQYKQP